MVRKIILGLVITAVISLTSFGAVYAYQKEKLNLEKINAKEYGINYSGNGHQGGERSESVNEDAGLECPENEEQIRNNFRYREEENEDYGQIEAIRQEHQHMYEDGYNEDCDQECENYGQTEAMWYPYFLENEHNEDCERDFDENERSFQNLDENSNRQNRGGRS